MALLSWNDWKESTAFTRSRAAAAKGLGPTCPSPFSHSTPPPAQLDKLLDDLKKDKKKSKKKHKKEDDETIVDEKVSTPNYEIDKLIDKAEKVSKDIDKDIDDGENKADNLDKKSKSSIKFKDFLDQKSKDVGSTDKDDESIAKSLEKKDDEAVLAKAEKKGAAEKPKNAKPVKKLDKS